MRYFLFFFIFLGFKTISQNNTTSGIITYGYSQNSVTKAEREDGKELYEMLDVLNKKSKDINFQLKFNSSESMFDLENFLDSDLNPMAKSYANNVISKGKYYYSKLENITLREAHQYDKYTLIKIQGLGLKSWKLHKDKKKIGEYICYKATTIRTKKNKSGENSFVVEAWYCPQIPLPFGPKEYNGLPGLILELKDTHYTFYPKTIKFIKDKEIEINTLKSKRIITIDQHHENLSKL